MWPQENSAARWMSPIAGEGENEHKHTLNTKIKQAVTQTVQGSCLGNCVYITWVTKFPPSLWWVSVHQVSRVLSISAWFAVGIVNAHGWEFSFLFEGEMSVQHQTFIRQLLPQNYTNISVEIISHFHLPNSAQSSMVFCCGFLLLSKQLQGWDTSVQPRLQAALGDPVLHLTQSSGGAACRGPQQHSILFFLKKRGTENSDENLISISNMNKGYCR